MSVLTLDENGKQTVLAFALIDQEKRINAQKFVLESLLDMNENFSNVEVSLSCAGA